MFSSVNGAYVKPCVCSYRARRLFEPPVRTASPTPTGKYVRACVSRQVRNGDTDEISLISLLVLRTDRMCVCEGHLVCNFSHISLRRGVGISA
jgi:hypothetical protein